MPVFQISHHLDARYDCFQKLLFLDLARTKGPNRPYSKQHVISLSKLDLFPFYSSWGSTEVHLLPKATVK